MSDERFAVIGLGQFGTAIAKNLALRGAEVLAIDNSLEKVESIKSFSVENNVLYDLFSDQKNIVRTHINGKDKSFILIPENDKGMLNF